MDRTCHFMNLNDPNDTYSSIPEWIIEDLCDYYLFILKTQPNIFEQSSRDPITTFSMLFLGNPSLLKNPYLKSKLIEILFHFTLPMYQDSTGRTFGDLSDVFTMNPLARDYLISNLTRFYIDVEHSGLIYFYLKKLIDYRNALAIL